MPVVRIAVIDDHQIMVDGLLMLLAGQPEWTVVGTALNSEEGWKLVGTRKPDLVIMDLDLPGEDGAALTARIHAAHPDIKVLVLTGSAEPRSVRSALLAGASGFMLKSDAGSQLAMAIRAVMAGQTYLSPVASTFVVRDLRNHHAGSGELEALTARERDILARLANGQPTKEIAQALDVSTKTVDAHRHSLMRKLRVSNLADLTKLAVREGLVTL